MADGKAPPRQRVAIIHYWLVGMRGGERVLERLLHLYPDADIFTHVYDPDSVSARIRAQVVKTTFIQRLPGARTHYQKYLPLMPMALEELDLTGYDLVISSESGPAKGVIPPPTAAHVCYCHSPMRYLWDHYHSYRRSSGLITRLAMPPLMHGLRMWDATAAARVDSFAANSNFVRQRILSYYRREAEVIFPPVDLNEFNVSSDVSEEYLWVGELIHYKRPDLAVQACTRLGRPLLVVGGGPMETSLRKMAGPTVRFARKLGFPELKSAYARAKALIFTAEEDFGMVPVEAMASGRPVIGYGRGGLLDTVAPQTTGIYFDRQDVDDVADAIERFEAWLPHFDPAAAQAQVQQFGAERFDEAFSRLVTRTQQQR